MSVTGNGEPLTSLAGGRYVLSRTLGTGASAIVYQARDTALGVERAVKVLHSQGAAAGSVRKRLQAEARAMARLSHRHILKVYDVGEQDGRPFVVMDLASGGNLARRIDEEGPLSEAVALRYGLQILSALAAAHAEGIVHRDVKPQNVLLDDKGVAMLGDFGIALHLEDEGLRSTQTGAALGTLAFMAPEQRLDARSVGPPADIYGVAASLFFLITGDNPVDLFGVDDQNPRWRGLSEPVRHILVRATRYRPEDRYATAADMAREIVTALAMEGGVHEDPLDPRQFPAPSARLSAGDRARSPAAPTTEWETATLDAAAALVGAAHPPFPVTVPATPATVGPVARRAASRPGSRWLPLVLALLGLAASAAVAIVALSERADVPAGEVATPREAPSEEPRPAPVRPEEDQAPPPAEPAPEEVAAVVAPTPRPAPAASPLPSPEPAAPAPADEGTGPPPLGRWTGAFNGRPAVFALAGTLDAVEGTVSVSFGANVVHTPVTGRYDPATRSLVLEDTIDTIDAGRYTATLSADGRSLEGRFNGVHNGRLLSFALRSGSP